MLQVFEEGKTQINFFLCFLSDSVSRDKHFSNQLKLYRDKPNKKKNNENNQIIMRS